MCECWRLIELTNGAIGPVAVGGLIPLGAVTRKVAKQPRCTPTFTVETTANNVVTVSEPGIYNVTYTATLVAGAAGVVTVNLLQNGTAISTRSVSAAAAGDSVVIPISREIRVRKECCCNQTEPIQLGLSIAGTAITDGKGTLIVNRQAIV